VPKTTPDRIERLRSVELFAGLGDPVLRRILDRATEFEVPAGHVLIQPHLEASGMFVVEEGTVSVERPDLHVERGPGDFFGELALLSEHGHRSARVQAKTAVRGLAISREDFWAMLEEEPAIAVSMLRVVGHRLSERE
jgi:CRP-like cAMP-binding protein